MTLVSTDVQVVELWRYPVKSLLGERLDAATATVSGIEGDRRFALFDVETGFGLTARRVPELLFASARVVNDGDVEITLPDGTVTSDDETLSSWLGRRVELRSADAAEGARRYENPSDFEDESTGGWAPFEGAGGAFHDSGRSRVSLVSAATIGAWDGRRFRTNIYLDGDGEDGLIGARLQIGDAVLDVTKRIARCVMTTRAQAGGVERDLDVLRTINRDRQGCLSVGALVEQEGTIRVGDSLHPL
jgi:uncharacterized protein YcbX